MKVTSERLFLVTSAIKRKTNSTGYYAELFELRTESESDTKVYGINWSACGTVSTEETKKFTEMLSELTAYAEELNNLKIEEIWGNDPKIKTKEEARAFVERVENELKPGNIKTFLEV